MYNYLSVLSQNSFSFAVCREKRNLMEPFNILFVKLEHLHFCVQIMQKHKLVINGPQHVGNYKLLSAQPLLTTEIRIMRSVVSNRFKHFVMVILYKSSAPLIFWFYCVVFAVDCHNYTVKELLGGKVPFTILNGDTADISAFRYGL